MFDGSHLTVEENLEKAAKVVEFAHANGVSVEAEVGTIGGEEDGIIGDGELAPIEDAKAMVASGQGEVRSSFLDKDRVGYTSVMFDGSHLPVEENLEKAAKVVEFAHANGVSVEAEVDTSCNHSFSIFDWCC